ncbi:BTAD domain-containing putative transcriptional regulator [Streptosporangium subroseum]|uniref:AfsR/SARP family transcriptional regulator n=1 Tax=Streptosporangium subroseum TaxID=106412 RepID=UPI003447C771
MRFGILGSTEVRLADGHPAAIGGPGLRALLGLLLLDAGRVVTAERLIDGLYGTTPPAGAVNALQAQVSRLRHLLAADGDVVVRHPAGYRLAVDPESVDAHRFGRLAAEGRGALDAGDNHRAAELLREALDLWRGPALADVLEAPFAAAQAARLEELRVAAAEDHVEARLALGRHRETIAGLQELIAAHPLRERLRGQLMRALYACGRQGDALAAYEDTRRRLADELGADPSAELAAIHLSVLRADPSLTSFQPDVPRSAPKVEVSPAAPEIAALGAHDPRGASEADISLTAVGADASPAAPETDAPPIVLGTDDPSAASQDFRHGLPAQLTPLIGRADELTRLKELLAGGRLVTLTGPGGIGKTRLAMEVAGDRPGNVCFVQLAPLGDGADVPQAVLSALGLRESGVLPGPGRTVHDPLARLTAALADRRMLLVLDNCEHVVGAAAQLADQLLSGSPTLRVLATSREPLGITGETLLPVPPLRLPPPGTAPARAPAIRLFADRATAVRPDFTMDDATAQTVLRICQALDGLPLAIELAAARLRSLPITEIAARLDDRFRLLSRGSRTAQPRHQTLRAVVEWSWDLLEEDERVLARRLTVFTGGATLEAAEQVSGLPDTIDLLTGLVDKSLVEVVGDRYRMLDTIRAFCAERLADADEGESLRRAHGEYFLRLAETADPHLRGGGQLQWLRMLDREHDNLYAALHRAIEPDPAFALRLLSALTPYWWLRGLRSEGASPARELLGRIGSQPPAGLSEEYALCVLTIVSSGDHGPGLRPHIETARSIIDSLGYSPRQPFIFALYATALGPPSSDSHIERMRDLERLRPEPWVRALAEFGFSFRWLWDGQLPEAERRFEAALESFRSLGDRWGMVMSLATLAELAGWHGDGARLAALTSEALGLAEELDATADMAELLCRRADGDMRAGELDGARADYERAAGLARRAGAPELLADAGIGLGQIARLRGDLDEARRHYETALAGCGPERYASDEMRKRVHVALGWLAETEGDARTALDHHRLALTSGSGQRNLPLAALAAEGLAGVALLEGDGKRAAFLLGVGTALRGTSLAGDPDVARVRTGTRARIGGPAFDAAYERGAALATDQILAGAGRILTDTDRISAIADRPPASAQ